MAFLKPCETCGSAPELRHVEDSYRDMHNWYYWCPMCKIGSSPVETYERFVQDLSEKELEEIADEWNGMQD